MTQQKSGRDGSINRESVYPKTPLAVIEALLPAELKESILGDLIAEVGQRYGAEGRSLRATAWCWLQAGSIRYWGLWRAVRSMRSERSVDNRRNASLGNIQMQWPIQPSTLLRSVIRRPLSSATILLTFSLSIGIGTLLFSTVESVLLRPLPYPNSERLVSVWNTNQMWANSNSTTLQALWDRFPLSFPMFRQWQEETNAFSAIGAYASSAPRFSGNDGAELVNGSRVTYGVFQALGVSPLTGRTFSVEDGLVGADRVVVLSYGFWDTHFGRDIAVLGQSIILDGLSMVVIGVMPEGFYFPSESIQIWTNFSDVDKTAPDTQFLSSIGRVRDGVDFRQATANLETITSQLASVDPDYEGLGVRLVPRHEDIVGNARASLLMISGAFFLVLIIASVNISGLLLTRARSRLGDLALRGAVGAGKSALLKESMFESIALGLVGGGSGILLGAAGLSTLKTLLPAGIPRQSEISLNPTALGIALGLTLLSAVLAGLPSAVLSTRVSLRGLISGSSTGSGRLARFGWKSSVIVASQVALALTLVVGVSLLTRSLLNINSVDKGFESEGLLVASISVPDARYPSGEVRAGLYEELKNRLEGTPGILKVTLASDVPLAGGSSSGGRIVNRGSNLDEIATTLDWSRVGASFFDVMGVDIIQGSGFGGDDEGGSTPVAIVNRAAAEQYWPNGDPIGGTVRRDRTDAIEYQIIGVAENVRHQSLTETPNPKYYTLLEQTPVDDPRVVVRTASPSANLGPQIRSAIWERDRDIVPRVSVLNDVIDRSLATPRFRAIAIGGLGILAILLAAAGIYAILASSVTERLPEFGVRMAMGAAPSKIVREIVLLKGLPLIGTGIAAGLLIALFLNRWLESVLFEISPSDPETYIWAIGLVLGAGLVGTLGPAIKAAKVDPVSVLQGR